jgi:hypothetical protein
MDERQKKFRETSEDLDRFLRRVGQIWKYEELKFLDLEPSTMSGIFNPGRLYLLQEFCALNLNYHIVSCRDYKVYNKLVPNANSYYLADGDKDVELIVDLLSRLTADDFLQVGHTMLAPIFRDIKRSS